MVARDGNPGWQRPTASFPPGVETRMAEVIGAIPARGSHPGLP
jgi:hypothetical protein